ncbi:MAG: HNH endonuclease signature motif containing protein [Shewanella sp.]
MAPRFKYTREMFDFVTVTCPSVTIPELVDLFNAKFGTDKTAGQMKSFMGNNGIVTGRKAGDTMRGRSYLFTTEQSEWLATEYTRRSVADLYPDYVERFGNGHTFDQVYTMLRRRGHKSGRTGHFTKGIVPWNTGLKGFNPGGNSAVHRFKPGVAPKTWRPVGSELVTKDGYVKVKIAEPRTWRLKHIHLWEQVNGPLPAGHALIFRDNDRLNSDPDNMILVKRSVLGVMNKLGLNLSTPEHKELAITIAQIYIARNKHGKR